MLKTQKYIKQIAVCILIILLIAAAFFVFIKENRNRIEKQNMEYVKDSTLQIAGRVDDVMSDGYDNIRILSTFLSDSLESPEVDVEQLREIAGESVFDFIEFADKNGMDHNVTGGVSDARDRQYYLDGMKGHSGLEVIFDSRATHETLLMFYSPVFYEEETIGVVIGVFQAENRLARLLQADYFGEQASLYLCDPEGRAVASNMPLDTKDDLRVSQLAGEDDELAARMNESLKTGKSITFTVGKVKTGGCMAQLPDNGWFLVQIFPQAANEAMVRDANSAGIRLEALLLAVFGAVLIMLIVFFKKERRQIEDVAEERGKYKNAVLADAIIVFEANLTKNRIDEGAWKDSDGKPQTIETVLGLSLPCSYDTYIDRWAHKYVREEDRELFVENTSREYLNRAFEEGKSEITFDYDARSLDGEEIFVRRSIYMTRDRKTSDVIAYSNVKDITEMKRSQSQSKQYEQLLINTASGIYLGIWQVELETFDATYIFFENNHMRSEEKGNWSQWIKGQLRNVHPDDREMVSRQLERETLLNMAEGTRTRCDFRGGTKNKNGIYRMYSSSIFRTERGGKPYISMATMENTAAVEREMRQKALIEEALQRAENANKAKTVFLSNMSHDIRTPMNAIIGFTDLAIKNMDDREKVGNYLDKIASSGSHLLSLINDVLDMSRIESGQMQLDEAECDLEQLVAETRDILLPQMASKGLNFSVDTGALHHSRVICDKLRIERILLNLLGNAIKFTEPGGDVSLSVVGRDAKAARSAVYDFHVKDTGIGMSEEFQKHIFEPFERERTSTVSGIQGTGLGMTITKNIIDMMGGSIWVSSRKGEGSEFTVRLTLQKLSAGTQISEAADEKYEKSKARKPVEGQRLLLAEDNELNREIAIELLSEAGFVIEAAENGKKAVEMLTEKGRGYYSLVLMDIQMPVMDGYEATKAIRAFEDPELASIPIIAMTANAFDSDQKQVIEEGMDGYIAKPVDVEKMLDTLDELL